MSSTARRTRDLPALLAEQIASAGTGILTARRGPRKRLFCLENGWIVFTRSNLVEEQFGRFLAEQGILPESAVTSAEQQAKNAGRTLTAFLLAEGFPPADALRTVLEHQVGKLLRSTLAWEQGEYSFNRGRPQLDKEPRVRLSAVPAMLDAAGEDTSPIERIRVAIGPPDVRLELDPRRRSMAEGMPLSPAARFALECCDRATRVEDLLSSSPHGDEATLRMLRALQRLGVLRTAEVESEQTVARETVSREEILGRISKAEGADRYAVLGVDPRAEAGEIRAAYYKLARRLHPDRFRAGELADMLEQIEGFFAMVTEAHNTLSDPDLRAEYNRQLAEATAKGEETDSNTGYLARQNYMRARALIEKRRFQEAVRFLENAVELDNTRPEFFLELGRVLALNPRHRAAAEQHLETCLQLDPSLVDAYCELGELCLRTDRLEEAAARFREVLRWEPGNLQAQTRLQEMGLSDADGGLLRGLFKG